MSATLDLGRRIELVSMDPHFSNITIGLYQCSTNAEPEYLVHSYSRLPGVRDRLNGLVRAMQVLAGMVLSGDRLRFPCGARHQLAARRTFLEACKLGSSAPAEPRPLEIIDKKLNHRVTVRSLGSGLYELAADAPPEVAGSRLESIAGGLNKLAELNFVPGQPHRVQFGCGHAHDALVGLLLPRALNVRAILREQEVAASRGVLVAPSAQK